MRIHFFNENLFSEYMEIRKEYRPLKERYSFLEDNIPQTGGHEKQNQHNDRNDIANEDIIEL